MTSRSRIIAIPGSMSQSSVNLSLIRSIIQNFSDRLDIKVFTGLSAIPHFNPDLDNENPPENVSNFRRQLKQADGILICTPEYAMGVPGTLKNAIDWASRPSDKYPRSAVFSGKFAAMMSSSPGSLGGVRSLSHLRGVLTSISVNVLPQEIAVPFAEEKFAGDDEEMIDETIKARLEELGALLVEMLEKTHC